MAELIVSKRVEKEWELVIYVVGETPTTKNAIDNLRKVCEEELEGRYYFDVVDLKRHPERASKDEILAIPTIIRNLPLPIKRIIGDLSQKEKVFVGLGFRPIN